MKLFEEGRAKYFYPVLFADGGGGAEGKGGDVGDSEGAAGGGSKSDPGADSGGSKDQGQSSEGDNKPFATFPTEASFMARLKQGSRAELRAMAEELGFESPDALKAAAKKAKEIEEKNKTDLERERERANQAEQRAQQTAKNAAQKLINAELKVLAAQSKFIDPEDAVTLASRAEIEIDEETGTITGAKEAIDALAKLKPHLLSKAGVTVGGSSANPGGDVDPGLSEEEQGRKLAEQRLKQKAGNVAGALNPWASSEQ